MSPGSTIIEAATGTATGAETETETETETATATEDDGEDGDPRRLTLGGRVKRRVSGVSPRAATGKTYG